MPVATVLPFGPLELPAPIPTSDGSLEPPEAKGNWIVRLADPCHGYGQVPEGFPFIVDDKTGNLFQPGCLFLFERSQSVVRRLSKRTIPSYAYDLKDWLVFLEEFGKSWDEATPDLFNSYFRLQKTIGSVYTGRPFGKRTLERRAASVLSFQSWAIARGYLSASNQLGPTPKFDARPDENFEPTFIPAEHFDELLKTLGPENSAEGVTVHRLIAAVEASVGLRVGEALGLQARDFKKTYNENQIVPVRIVRKGERSQDVWFFGTVMNLLAQYVKGERAEAVRRSGRDPGYLFVHPAGDKCAGHRIRVRTFERRFRDACIACGYFVTDESGRQRALYTPHSLRHSFAMFTYEMRKNIYHDPEPWLYVQQRLGHKDVATTMRTYLNHRNFLEQDVSNRFVQTVKEQHEK